MFGLKNHTNNLQYSQRFYYSNYQFYNDYDDPIHFQNDISKVSYSCKRKTTPVITKYCNHFSTPENREIRSSSRSEPITMQQFLDSFILTYQQNNYSDFPDNALQSCKNTFKISLYPKDSHLQSKHAIANVHSKENVWSKPLSSLEILNTLLIIQQETIADVLKKHNNQEISNEDIDFYGNLLAFSELAHELILEQLKNHEEGARVRFNLFRMLIEQRLSSIMQANTSSHQIMYIPKINSLSYFINPALCAVKNFILKQQQYSKSQSSSHQAFHRQIPKIAFINLDGVESPLNLQFIRNSISQSLFYITIYKEMEDFNQNYDQASSFYSRFLAKLIHDCNNMSVQKQKNLLSFSNVLAFPLNSSYVHSKLSHCKSYQPSNLSGTSSQINFLFQNCIYQQLRSFSPNIIFISYNGRLQIEQPQFNQILRKLTLISHHKIILFPNFCTLFHSQNYLTQMTQKWLANRQKWAQNEQIIQINSQPASLLGMAKFLQQYSTFQLQNISVNQLFNNFGMFNKITSGSYSFEQQREIKPHKKFEVGKKYAYLETLSKLQQFSNLKKYCNTNQGAQNFSKLLNMRRDNLLNKNKQQIIFFQKYLNEAIKKITQSPSALSKKLKYRFQRLKYNLQIQKKDINAYLQDKKKLILIQSITKQKISRVFSFQRANNPKYTSQSCSQMKEEGQETVAFSPVSIKQVHSFQLYIRNSKGEKQKILLDSFSQIFIDPLCTVIFCINYLNSEWKLCTLYGYINSTQKSVQMKILNSQSSLNCNNEATQLYFQYSSYFNQQNNKLYLYWPYVWQPVAQCQHLLLQQKYQPNQCNTIHIIPFNSVKRQPILQSDVVSLKQDHWKGQNYMENQKEGKQMQNQNSMGQKQKFINCDVLPRFGSSMWSQTENQLYIFGGYFYNQHDFQTPISGITKVTINQNKFKMEDIPKSILGARLRPKANYIIERVSKDKLIIKGGYGRQFTNFYNVYSYISYIFTISTHKLEPQKTHRHINSLDSPISNKTIGNYQVVRFESGTPKQAKTGDFSTQPQSNPSFSNSLGLNPHPNTDLDKSQSSSVPTSNMIMPNMSTKHRFIFRRNNHNHIKTRTNDNTNMDSDNQNEGNIVSFINDQYTVKTHKQDNTSFQLFEFNQHIGHIYTQTSLSPQLYITKKSHPSHSTPIRIELLTSVLHSHNDHNPNSHSIINLMSKNYMLPQDDAIICSCFNEFGDKYYMLCRSLFTGYRYVVYLADLAHVAHVINNKEIQAKQYFLFGDSYTDIQFKSITAYQDSLYVLGGVPNQFGYRQDYIITSVRGIVKAKLIKVTMNQSQLLQMKNSYIVKHAQKPCWYLYSISTNPQFPNTFLLKIQQVSLNPQTRKLATRLFQSNLTICTILNNEMYEIKPDLKNPVFVHIHRYYLFNFDVLFKMIDQLLKKLETVCLVSKAFNWDLQALNQILMPFLNNSKQYLLDNLDALYGKMSQYAQFIRNNQSKYNDFLQIAHYVNDITANLITIYIEQISLKLTENNQQKQLYRFYVEDRHQKICKYIAIGQLFSCNLVFFRFKFAKRIAIMRKNFGKQQSNGLYGCNLVANNLNSIIFSDDKYVSRFIQEGQQSVHITEIEAFQPQMQQHEGQCELI